jgi:hypothetical protein
MRDVAEPAAGVDAVLHVDGRIVQRTGLEVLAVDRVAAERGDEPVGFGLIGGLGARGDERGEQQDGREYGTEAGVHSALLCEQHRSRP